MLREPLEVATMLARTPKKLHWLDCIECDGTGAIGPNDDPCQACDGEGSFLECDDCGEPYVRGGKCQPCEREQEEEAMAQDVRDRD